MSKNKFKVVAYDTTESNIAKVKNSFGEWFLDYSKNIPFKFIEGRIHPLYIYIYQNDDLIANSFIKDGIVVVPIADYFLEAYTKNPDIEITGGDIINGVYFPTIKFDNLESIKINDKLIQEKESNKIVNKEVVEHFGKKAQSAFAKPLIQTRQDFIKELNKYSTSFVVSGNPYQIPTKQVTSLLTSLRLDLGLSERGLEEFYYSLSEDTTELAKNKALDWWNSLSEEQRDEQATVYCESDEMYEEHSFIIYCPETKDIERWYERHLEEKLEISQSLKAILINCYKEGIDSVTFPAGSFEIESLLTYDDKDYVTFWRNSNLSPVIIDKLMVCNEETVNVWKDWNMTINYHA